MAKRVRRRTTKRRYRRRSTNRRSRRRKRQSKTRSRSKRQSVRRTRRRSRKGKMGNKTCQCPYYRCRYGSRPCRSRRRRTRSCRRTQWGGQSDNQICIDVTRTPAFSRLNEQAARLKNDAEGAVRKLRACDMKLRSELSRASETLKGLERQNAAMKREIDELRKMPDLRGEVTELRKKLQGCDTVLRRGTEMNKQLAAKLGEIRRAAN